MSQVSPVFAWRGQGLERAQGWPPAHPERFEWSGYDLADLLGSGPVRGTAEVGLLLGLLLGVGLFLVVTSGRRRSRPRRTQCLDRRVFAFR